MVLLPAIAALVAFVQGPANIGQDVPAKYQTPKPPAGSVVARVNGIDIKVEDVEPFLWQWRGYDVLQDLITYEMVKTEADKLRISVPDSEVEAALAAGLKEMEKNLQPGESLDQMMLRQGFTRSRLFLRYKTEAMMNTMAIRMYDPKKLVKVSTIVFPHTSEAASISLAIKRAEAAYDRLKKGDKWDDVLASATTNAQILKTKGLLGWRELSAFPKPVQEEMKTLKGGDTTKPAQTDNGMQIFRIEVLGKDAKPNEEKEMRAAFTNAAKQTLMNRIRSEAQIERMYPPSGH